MNANSSRAAKAPVATGTAGATQRTWIAPQVQDLPRLTALTLQTGDPIDGWGGTGGGGSGVF